ncbi:MAG: hypothetical protein ACFFDI_17630 [Promethearchaeota archaeon]
MSKINCEICGRRLNIRWSFSSYIRGEHVYCSFTCYAIGQRYTSLLFFIFTCALYLVFLVPQYLDMPQLTSNMIIVLLYLTTFALLLPASILFVTIWGFYNKGLSHNKPRDIPDIPNESEPEQIYDFFVHKHQEGRLHEEISKLSKSVADSILRISEIRHQLTQDRPEDECASLHRQLKREQENLNRLRYRWDIAKKVKSDENRRWKPKNNYFKRS